ncbi:Translation initiation factor IF-2 [Candidatus Protochlamydia naegleriophila]|uniref:Translation initiation factor IF-2 n=1 Tax=Candidatus Protochlamydia naegleriophila TaxID=389348 RepID=A0A0U5ES22_9BACT|nr:Translation initiation factor IF-2 [Candidatus Protochlamydia naegleriophila]
MAKNLKLNIKNAQIAEAINLTGLKSKLAKKKEEDASKKASPAKSAPKTAKAEAEELPKEEAPRIRARSKSAFAESSTDHPTKETPDAIEPSGEEELEHIDTAQSEEEEPRIKTSAEIRQEIFGEDFLKEPIKSSFEIEVTEVVEEKAEEKPAIVESSAPVAEEPKPKPVEVKEKAASAPAPHAPRKDVHVTPREVHPPRDKLGPTGKHMRDFLKPKAPPQPQPKAEAGVAGQSSKESAEGAKDKNDKNKIKPKAKAFDDEVKTPAEDDRKGIKTAKFKEFRDVKPARKQETRQFDARDRQGLRSTEDDQHWRKRRAKQRHQYQEDTTIRPTSLKVRLPITIKDLASEMKLKASQLVGKLFLQGIVVTLNDILEDETTIQLLGQEFGCDISIDTAEEKRIQITDKSIREELQHSPPEQLQLRPPVVAFMGHVDHGKTSLIDAIRKSNRAAGEAGAITQHIGAFRCHTAVGDIAILDTPGHEAFSAMRARGADVTDIVVLVVAGDEGLRQQTIEAIQHARAANVIMVVAINKSDKPNFNPETVYRQLSEQNLLPEAWGGQTITVNCSAVTGEGIPELLEMLALQAEVLELRANPEMRARGTVLESEMHKGMGSVATILVQNGTLRRGDALVFGLLWGRVKTMHDEYGKELQEAGPSTPVEITGLSGLPEAGQEFIVVKNEKEARDIAEVRSVGARQTSFMQQQKKKVSMENILQQASATGKKTLNLVLRADVQGSLEALKVALLKIESDKADLNIIFTGVGEVSESDVQLAAASKAVILGFHTQIESHAEPLVKQLGIQVRLHSIIYHAIDDIKILMAGLLEKIAQETEKGKAIVKATFKSSHAGVIAGCQVSEGSIHRNNYVRLKRGQETVWKGTISSLKRVKEDVREVQKGLECGILLNNYTDIREGDIIEAYDVTYISQEL